MLVTEYPWNGRYNRIRHYSDEGFMILQEQTGFEYEEAVDIFPTNYTYIETDHKPPEPEEPEPIEEQIYEWE